jgi:hypothetical protein
MMMTIAKDPLQALNHPAIDHLHHRLRPNSGRKTIIKKNCFLFILVSSVNGVKLVQYMSEEHE